MEWILRRKDMELPKNIMPITNKQPIKFSCTACGACCKNVKDSIILEPLDAFRIIAEKKKKGCTDSEEDILLDIAELKELSPCFSVFVLKTDDSGKCDMLQNNRCSIYDARPRTCRHYPFSAELCLEEKRIKWLLCTEQAHHFRNGTVTAREWQRKYVSNEEEEFLYEECRVLPEIGELLRRIPEDNQFQADIQVVAYRYFAYDYTKSFLPQYKENMLFLRSLLKKLAG